MAPVTCPEHGALVVSVRAIAEGQARQETLIASLENEVLSHLSVLSETMREHQAASDARVEEIASRVAAMAGSSLTESLNAALPGIIETALAGAGRNKAEKTKGRWAFLAALCLALGTIGGAVGPVVAKALFP